jgi:hypothetical protein
MSGLNKRMLGTFEGFSDDGQSRVKVPIDAVAGGPSRDEDGRQCIDLELEGQFPANQTMGISMPLPEARELCANLLEEIERAERR